MWFDDLRATAMANANTGEVCDMVPTGLANTFVERVAAAAAQRPQ